MKWTKETSLALAKNKDTEKWIRQNGSDHIAFDLDIYLGKKTDLLKLKKNIVETIKKQVSDYQTSRTKLYSSPEKEIVDQCPVCKAKGLQTEDMVNIYGAEYVQCPECSHVYVKNRPSQKSIHDFYLNDVTYAATYTDKQAAESRLNAIAVPWLKWVIEVYKKQYGRMPKKILDVGSGAGHFVEACKREGIEAYGIELSQSSRQFAKDIWGFEMDGRNFIDVAPEYNDIDIVTFWGLLEHTPDPGKILASAHETFSDQGMVISKLPRWDSLASAVQVLNNNTIIRHLDPMGHIMAFTDASAAELYFKNNFSPVAAWYYGMDVYETLMQVGHITDDYVPLNGTKDLQVELQQYIDETRFSDGLTLVGIPQK